MADNATVLVADDEGRMRGLVRMYLEREGYRVLEAADGEEALNIIREQHCDLVVLDLMMPVVDGWTVCKEIRVSRDLPVIMLTARGDEYDRLLGFDLGADDYITKPFSPRELVARVKALMRRARPEGGRRDRLQFPGLSIDAIGRSVKSGDRVVTLTPKEFDLLFFLARHHGQVLSREQLLQQVWGYDFYGDLRTVDTHMKNLREKLGKDSAAAGYLKTVWGVGYKFEVGT